MKILHLVAGNLNGGAARGAYWLHQALNNIDDVESHLVTNGEVVVGDSTVTSLCARSYQKYGDRLRRKISNLPISLYKERQKTNFNTGFWGVNFKSLPVYEEADLVHLHWINGLVSIRSLSKIKKPIVWTLRDMWPMTGGCHYSMDCERFTTDCGKCVQLGSESYKDLSRTIVNHKRAHFPNDMQLVAISRWLAETAEASSLFASKSVTTISNNINISLFFPASKICAREQLNLPINKKIVLVGAQNISLYYKGFGLFLGALNNMSIQDVHVVAFGSSKVDSLKSLQATHSNLGFINDDETLRLLYSAADVFVAPSTMDAFGKTVAESMACGTPAVCFDATGVRDIVSHLETGYKAKPFSESDLAAGIRWVLDLDKGSYKVICQAATTRARDLFSSKVIAAEYRELYLNMLAGRSR